LSKPSNWRAEETLNNYLKRNNIIGIEKIDTRALTRILREKGTMKGMISTDPNFNLDDKIDEIKAYVIKDPVMCVERESIPRDFYRRNKRALAKFEPITA